jgi:hypothetical protein
MEFHLNCEKFFYTKDGMFGLNESSGFQIDPEIIKLAIVFNPRNQTKSNFHNIEHLIVIVGQRSTSSSGDG